MIEIIDFDSRFFEQTKKLVLDIQQNEVAIPVTAEQQPDLMDIEGFYIGRGGNFWLALDNDEVVGTLGLLNAGSKVGLLRKMFVQQTYRGAPHFTAKKLLMEFFDWAKKTGYNDIYLGTLEKLKAAQRFYEKNGFRPIAEDSLPPLMHQLKLPLDRFYYHYDLTAKADNA